MKSFLSKEFSEFEASIKKANPLLLTTLVLAVVSMNLLANKELFRTEWVALDCGFVLSWIPFLIMDAVCKAYGGKAAVHYSLLAIVMNLLLFLVFKIVSLTPGMWGSFYSTGLPEVNNALNTTIGGSTWIVLGSSLAMAVSAVTNSIVNISVARLMSKDNYASFAARSFISTAIGQFVDNLVFALVVSVTLFGWSYTQALLCSITAAGFELLMEALFSGLGYKLSRKL